LRTWLLIPWLRAFGIALILTAAVAAIVAIYNWWSETLPTATVGQIVMTLFGFVVALALPTIYRIVYYRESATRVLLNVGAAIVGWVVVWIHIKIIDRLFLRHGRVKGQK